MALLVLTCCSLGPTQALPLPSPELNQPWPMYRGDLARDGHPAGATLGRVQAGKLALAWRANLVGAVDGSPAIAGGLVIAGSMGGRLAAFDESTGTLVWRQDGLGEISGSPAIAGGRVYIATLAGHVRAFDLARGGPIWDWKVPAANAAIWSSPTAYRDLLVIAVSSAYGDSPFVPGRLFGLDSRTGRERWSVCVRPACQDGDGIWSTPSIDSSGVAYVGVGNPDDGVLAFDAATGHVLWDRSLYADGGLDLDVGASPVILAHAGREVVAVGSNRGTFAVLDARTGTVIWSKDLVTGSAVHGLIATSAYDGKVLYVPSASPPTGLFALTTAGSVTWNHQTDLPVYSSPALGDGVIVFGTGAVFGDLGAGSIVALSTADGREVWSYDTHSAVRSSPAVAGSLVVAGDYAGDLLAFRPIG
ncbi:MAG: PQQ-binding-like beta-propeller repeat protein [Candidatus Dormibacteraceae bacterium]